MFKNYYSGWVQSPDCKHNVTCCIQMFMPGCISNYKYNIFLQVEFCWALLHAHILFSFLSFFLLNNAHTLYRQLSKDSGIHSLWLHQSLLRWIIHAIHMNFIVSNIKFWRGLWDMIKYSDMNCSDRKARPSCVYSCWYNLLVHRAIQLHFKVQITSESNHVFWS